MLLGVFAHAVGTQMALAQCAVPAASDVEVKAGAPSFVEVSVPQKADGGCDVRAPNRLGLPAALYPATCGAPCRTFCARAEQAADIAYRRDVGRSDGGEL
jgi:hypothetical protein